MTVAAPLFLAFFMTVIGVYLFRIFALRTERLLDIPNERSSHMKPVTRGAGFVITLTVLGLYLAFSGSETNLVFVGVASLIALIGFIDDLYSLPLLPRLAVHIIAAAIFVYCAGPLDAIRLPLISTNLELGLAGPVIVVIFIVWTTNAFNFMDGIDGIAGSQGIAAGLGWMLFGLVTGSTPIAVFGSIVVGACSGFLIFNWQPASVFMGDVGSTFLGFALAAVPFIDISRASIAEGNAIVLALAFLWLFLFDTIYTRARQVLSGKAFWRPHREHLYQKLVIGGSSHRRVSLFYFVCGVLISAATALRSEIGDVLSLLLVAVCSILLLMWVQKKEIDVT